MKKQTNLLQHSNRKPTLETGKEHLRRTESRTKTHQVIRNAEFTAFGVQSRIETKCEDLFFYLYISSITVYRISLLTHCSYFKGCAVLFITLFQLQSNCKA